MTPREQLIQLLYANSSWMAATALAVLIGTAASAYDHFSRRRKSR